MLSFFCFWTIMAVFHYELLELGLDFPPPVVGSNVFEVAGVVLFNYAFSVTVPAWLNEKQSDVSVNGTVWGASAVCSVAFVTFGLFAARYGCVPFIPSCFHAIVLTVPSLSHSTRR